MLKRDRFYFALALVTAAALGCGGGGDTAGTGGASSSSSATSRSSTPTNSRSASGLPNCMPGMGTVLAASALRVGEGMNGEWKKFGFNIDGKVSTGTSMDVCKPNAGGNGNTAYPDGDNGIDNSFGKNVLPTIL